MLATLFGFKGRLSRAGFIEVLLSVILIDVAALLSAKYVQEYGLPQVAAPGGQVALAVARFAPIVVAVFTAWTVVAAMAKRAHDRNRTGWLILLAIVPVVGWAWLLIDLFVLTGTKGRNSFGRAPFGTAAEARAEHVALAAMASAAHAHETTEAPPASASDHGHDAHGHDAHGHEAGPYDHGHDAHGHAAPADDAGHDAVSDHHGDSHAPADLHATAHHDPGHDAHAPDDDHGHDAHDDDHGHHAPADHHHAEPVHA